MESLFRTLPSLLQMPTAGRGSWKITQRGERAPTTCPDAPPNPPTGSPTHRLACGVLCPCRASSFTAGALRSSPGPPPGVRDLDTELVRLSSASAAPALHPVPLERPGLTRWLSPVRGRPRPDWSSSRGIPMAAEPPTMAIGTGPGLQDDVVAPVNPSATLGGVRPMTRPTPRSPGNASGSRCRPGAAGIQLLRPRFASGAAAVISGPTQLLSRTPGPT